MDVTGRRMDESRHKGMEDHHLTPEPAQIGRALRLPRADRPTLSLPAVHQLFADAISHAFSEHLPAPLTVVADGVDQLPYRDFLLTLPSATCIGVLRIDPPGVQTCVDLPRALIGLVVDCPTGGPPCSSGSPATPENDFLTSLTANLCEAWRSALGREVTIRFESLETEPESLHIMPAEERVTVMCFETSVRGTGGPEAPGMIRLCLPEPVVQHLLPAQSDPSLAGEDGDSGVDLRVVLAETKLPLSDLLAMQVGDIITTNEPADGAASVELDDSIAAPCRPGQFKGMRAVRVNHSLEALLAGRARLKQGSGESA